MSAYMPVEIYSEHRAASMYRDDSKRIVEHVLAEERSEADVRIVFVDDDHIHSLNKYFLKHDTVTDVICFPLEEEDGIIEGEIYVCIDQAERQAREYNVTVRNEIGRLVIHGVLHLIGYDDATPEKKSAMTDKENTYLTQLQIS